jgi:uncharacterized membrane protein
MYELKGSENSSFRLLTLVRLLAILYAAYIVESALAHFGYSFSYARMFSPFGMMIVSSFLWPFVPLTCTAFSAKVRCLRLWLAGSK